MYDTPLSKSTPQYQEALNYISRFQFHGFKLGLERMHSILNALDNPHKQYPCIHIAGTNGKGSVCAFLEAILKESGVKVGLYTSPHLYSLRERFRINGNLISEQELTGLIFEIKKFTDKGFELSYFEYTTTIAMTWFARCGVDLAIFETGLGGTLDATNVVTPIISIITNISLEHQAFLGNTIREIAGEKAGIIKPNSKVITGAKDPEALNVIFDVSRRQGAKLFTLGKDFYYTPKDNNHMDFFFGKRQINDLQVGLLGRHQMENASLSLAASNILEEEQWTITEDSIRKGLKTPFWPGRGEIIRHDFTCLLDGAHNTAGITALNRLLDEVLPEFRGRRKGLLWAMSDEGGDKDFKRLLNMIAHRFDWIVITEPPGPRRPISVESWKDIDLDISVKLDSDWNKALRHALTKLEKGDLLVVSGSLYLVGSVRTILRNEITS
ncbi:Dihydrofolate synthase [Dissulfuribacter thermophilus]|uniref:Dihydrofolate synthase/folylpolyglutamate synthase n=1 Tax=Dissulfuribacter thermophilus TaxID=1156395 RepID=A0A1B9F3F0_9BACT|nr:folylpolyglutamate synthase/dihydrofolate synthase family protein [Dissulfuribacter thermophilus]OCC14467.1 Dihydrofolate synthase [Dissulfuribacter thermophilus]